MAAKTNIINFILILIVSTQLFAQSDEQQLVDWTKKNESKLLEKYKTVRSDWFEKQCLLLAIRMKFKKINKCTLFKSDNINAYVFNNGHVYFSTSIIALIKNKHQWASILAHENAHIELQHYLKTLKKIKNPNFFFPKRKIRKMLKKHEQEADYWAYDKLKEYKFNPEQIYFFLNRVENIKGNNKNKHHLKLSKRINKTNEIEIINQALINNFLKAKR